VSEVALEKERAEISWTTMSPRRQDKCMARCRGLAHGVLEVIVPFVTGHAALVPRGLEKNIICLLNIVMSRPASRGRSVTGHVYAKPAHCSRFDASHASATAQTHPFRSFERPGALFCAFSRLFVLLFPFSLSLSSLSQDEGPYSLKCKKKP